jgi:hypothetical protein
LCRCHSSGCRAPNGAALNTNSKTSPLTDEELLRDLEQTALPGDAFHHAEHVRAAFLYLCRYPLLEAVQKFSAALQRLAASQGKAHRYHQTITWAYLFLIHQRMARAGRPQTWQEFAKGNPDLLSWEDNIVKRYYRSETLQSELARLIFVFPDQNAPSHCAPNPPTSGDIR